MAQKTVIEFDVDRYLRNSKRLDLTGIDWDDIPNHALSDGDVMCLHYMMDIETHTVIYLRDLLAPRRRSTRSRFTCSAMRQRDAKAHGRSTS